MKLTIKHKSSLPDSGAFENSKIKKCYKRKVHDTATGFCIIILVFTTCILPQLLIAQTGYILWQDKEGSAAVYLDEEKQIAYLIDGGKAEAVPRQIDGMPVLKFLLSKKCENIVIVCSHPHDDHSGGFKQMIDSDSDLLKFKSIRFVDSGYPEKESLYERFISGHPTFPLQNVGHVSAADRNAFENISSEHDAVYVSNFKYTPSSRATEHGNSIISKIVLQKEGKRTVIIDFDDASEQLVAQWAAWAKEDSYNRRPDVVIAPHHCSDGTEIQPILDPQICPKMCVVTVDIDNRYLHPGPIMFNKWVRTLGVQAVHVSGAEEENIKITESGLPQVSDYSVLNNIRNNIINAQILTYKSVEGSNAKLKALADTQLAYRQIMGDTSTAPPRFSQSEGNSDLDYFQKNISSWIVTANSDGKVFVHRNENGADLNDLLYTAENEGGKWRVSKANGEYIGKIEMPPNISIGYCSCQ